MNIKELLEKDNKKISFYKEEYGDVWFNFSYEHLTSLEGLPDDINDKLVLTKNPLKDLKGLPEKFNNVIFLDKEISSLDGLNDVLDPKNIRGLDWDFIVSEYKRLGKHYLLV